MSDRATHCPSCGATVRSITREAGGRWSLSCGDWITDEQAAPTARPDGSARSVSSSPSGGRPRMSDDTVNFSLVASDGR